MLEINAQYRRKLDSIDPLLRRASGYAFYSTTVPRATTSSRCWQTRPISSPTSTPPSPDSAAMLLQGIATELSYRFALYGSLFLGSSAHAHQTFAKLKNIYTVRSKLVHGTIVRPERQQALDDAPALAKATVHKAIQQGWPDKKALDAQTLKAKE